MEGIIIYKQKNAGKEKNDLENVEHDRPTSNHVIKLANNSVQKYLGVQNKDIEQGNAYTAETALNFKLIQP